MCKICVFAGTTEGRQLIERLSGRGARLTACVATDYGEALLARHGEDVTVLSGRMDEAEMESFFQAERFDMVVDATHPYADRATENIAREGQETAVMTLRELADYPADMFTTVFVGNSQTKVLGGRLVTPRGYKDV